MTFPIEILEHILLHSDDITALNFLKAFKRYRVKFVLKDEYNYHNEIKTVHYPYNYDLLYDKSYLNNYVLEHYFDNIQELYCSGIFPNVYPKNLKSLSICNINHPLDGIPGVERLEISIFMNFQIFAKLKYLKLSRMVLINKNIFPALIELEITVLNKIIHKDLFPPTLQKLTLTHNADKILSLPDVVYLKINKKIIAKNIIIRTTELNLQNHNLTHLIIHGNYSFNSIEMPNIISLEYQENTNNIILPKSVKKLKITEYTEEIHNRVKNLKLLRKLWIKHLYISKLDFPETLEKLSIERMDNIHELPIFVKNNIKKFICHDYREFFNDTLWPNLESLELYSCVNYRQFFGLPRSLKKLTYICDTADYPDLTNTNIETIKFLYCSLGITKFPPTLHTLEIIIQDDDKKIFIPPVQNLYIRGTCYLDLNPHINKIKTLKKLYLPYRCFHKIESPTFEVFQEDNAGFYKKIQ